VLYACNIGKLLRSPLARVRTPSSLVSEREKERERASPERVIKRESEKEGEREKKDSIYF
jgi:hypothetical protein